MLLHPSTLTSVTLTDLFANTKKLISMNSAHVLILLSTLICQILASILLPHPYVATGMLLLILPAATAIFATYQRTKSPTERY